MRGGVERGGDVRDSEVKISLLRGSIAKIIDHEATNTKNNELMMHMISKCK